MKLVFFDIDGTLCLAGCGPSRASVETIRACRAKGNKVFICTGRTEGTVTEDVTAIGFDGGIYSAGGRIVVDGRELKRETMSPELVKHIMGVLEASGISYTLECEHCLYDGSEEMLTDGIDLKNASSELRRLLVRRKQHGIHHPVSEYRGEPVYKIVYLTASLQKVESLKQKLGQKAKVVSFDNVHPELELMSGEISAFEINKGAALRFLCDYFHADISQSIAFGDSMNDAEILIAAGTGIAMGNSTDEVKRLADQVCGSCENDGVAEMLLKMGLA